MGASAEENAELLPSLAAVVQHHVSGIGVDIGHVDDFGLDAGFFPNLAYHGIADGLAYIVAAAGQCPTAVVRSLNEENGTFVIPYERHDGRHHRVGRRGSRIVKVADASPVQAPAMSVSVTARALPQVCSMLLA